MGPEAGVGAGACADCASVRVSSVDDALHAASLGTLHALILDHYLQPGILGWCNARGRVPIVLECDVSDEIMRVEAARSAQTRLESKNYRKSFTYIFYIYIYI